MSVEYIEKRYSYKAFCPLCNIISTRTSTVRGSLNIFKRDVFGNLKTEHDLRSELEVRARELSQEKDRTPEVCSTCDKRRSSRDMKYIYKRYGIKSFEISDEDIKKYDYLKEKSYISVGQVGNTDSFMCKITEDGINFIKSFDIDFISV